MRGMIVIALLSAPAGSAWAQNTGHPDCSAGVSCLHQSTTDGMASTPEAPVGHRQPSEGNLTPRVRQQEKSGSTADPLGPLPRLCRNC